MLLDALARRARAHGAQVVALDCRAVEPTERGFLHAVGGFHDVAELGSHAGNQPGPLVVVLDHYEVFRLMDTWLRSTLVPALPAGATLVFGCRERPVAAWFGVAGFCPIPLQPLADDDARELLEARGVPATEAVRLNRIARGHPLALLRHRDYRRAAWRRLRGEMRAAAAADLWRYTADTLYLLDNPVVREAFFPSDAQPIAVEPATAADEPAILTIAQRHDGPGSVRALRRWWTVAPSTFSVSREGSGEVSAFFVLLDDARIRPALVGDDPVVASWARHLQHHPLLRGEAALGLRRWLDHDRGEAPGATQAACWLDVKRTYMALRPALRRMYVTVEDVPTYWPAVRELRFRPIAGPVHLDGRDYTTVVLDFGPDSVDGWLADVLATELGLVDEPALDAGAQELVVHGAPVALTPLEFGLFRHLRANEGRTVTRPDLLREVWGSEQPTGSNVVDAVVHTLRSKLGAEAPVIEAVRGRGYRLREDWRVHLA